MAIKINDSRFIITNGYFYSVTTLLPYVAPDIVTSGLTLYYNAADPSSYPGTGASWYDLTVGATTGSIQNNPTYNTAQGGYFSLNGTNNRVQSPSNDYTNFTSSFTIHTWMYPTALPTVGNIQSLVNKYDNTPVQGFPSGGYDLRILNSAGPTIFSLALNGSGSGQSTTVETNYAFSNNTWYCLTAVYDKSISKIILYVNAVQATSGSNTIDPKPNGKLLNIGAFGFYTTSGTDLGRYFNGGIANILLYNRVLSPSEILSNFNAQSASMF